MIIEPESKSIKIEQIRDVLETTVYEPVEAKKRFIVIVDAQMMNKSSSNALLKTLEEPPSNTIFLLLSKNINMLLPTIISRCETIRLSNLSEKDIAEMSNVEIDHEFLKYSYGSFDRFNFLNKNKEIIEKLISYINSNKERVSVSELLENIIGITDHNLEYQENILSLILAVVNDNFLSTGDKELIKLNKNIVNTFKAIYTNTSEVLVFENILWSLNVR